MKKILFGTIAIILSVSFLLFNQACKKQEMSNSSAQIIAKPSRGISLGIQFINGVQFFTNVDDLDQKIKTLKSMTELEFNSANASNSNFTSLYKQYQLLDELAENGIGKSAQESIELKLISNIPDDYFASVVNKNGLLAVDQTIYKYGPDGYQTAPITQLQNIEAYNWNSQTNMPYAKKAGNAGNQQWASFSPESRFFEKYNGSNNWPKSNGRPVRAIHTTWCSWFGVYASAGGKIKMEKKSLLAGWVNINHAQASNISSSNFRYFTMFSSGGGTFWAWDYYSKSDSKSTSNQHVNQIVLTYKPSLIAGPLQHEVGNFVSNVSIKFGGYTLNDTWTH